MDECLAGQTVCAGMTLDNLPHSPIHTSTVWESALGAQLEKNSGLLTTKY